MTVFSVARCLFFTSFALKFVKILTTQKEEKRGLLRGRTTILEMIVPVSAYQNRPGETPGRFLYKVLPQIHYVLTFLLLFDLHKKCFD